MKLKSNRWYRNLLFSCLSTGLITLSANVAQAQSQIIPDRTLDDESSSVTPNAEINGTQSDRIDGGATRGANLFHSFSEFNVGEGQGAYFINPAGIENILGRVTGGNPSEILGRLGVTGGDANLFLINPNGIIFGENASLDVGGSFMATTANGIKLGEEGSFNATEPQTSNLLSVNPSALFFNAMAAQSIVNRSQAESLNGETNSLEDPVGLQVAEGKSLALVGGDVSLEGKNSVGGNLTATGGRIELGSVAGVGEVSLNQSGDDLLLGYEDVTAFGDIKLEGAVVKASGGSSTIEAKNLIVRDGAQVITNVLGEEDGGILRVNTTGSIELIGTTKDGKFPSALLASTQGSGDAGNLMISTGSLIVRDGASVITATSSEGEGGDLNINATESIELIGNSTDGQIPSALFAGTVGSGDAGNLTIETGNLSVRNGALVSTATLEDLIARTGSLIVRNGALVSTATSSEGEGGDLNINASESIELIETTKDGQFNTGLFASTEGSGDAGNLTIETGNLSVRDGAQISVATLTLSKGDGGNLNINASESIELIGTTKDGRIPSGLFAGTRGDGDASSLNISTGQLTILDGATISSQSSGIGNAGNLRLDVSGTLLVDNSEITAVSTGDSGNIFINTENLQLLRGSRISTNAVNTDGGNIFINTDRLEALNNSDITANAQKGRGGLVLINAQDIFGTEARDAPTSQSDITASSKLGPQFNGIVRINGLEILPNIKLPQEPVQGEVVQNCQVTDSQNQSKFTVMGSGGVPPTPSESLRSTAIETNVVNSAASQPKQNITTQSQPIVEAQGWIVNESGNVVLTANANDARGVANFSPNISGCSQP